MAQGTLVDTRLAYVSDGQRTVQDLQMFCDGCNLSKEGTLEELRDRLVKYIKEVGEAPIQQEKKKEPKQRLSRQELYLRLGLAALGTLLANLLWLVAARLAPGIGTVLLGVFAFGFLLAFYIRQAKG